jgi:hypothetical protein
MRASYAHTCSPPPPPRSPCSHPASDDFHGVHMVADFATLVGTYSRGFAIITEPYDDRLPSVGWPRPRAAAAPPAPPTPAPCAAARPAEPGCVAGPGLAWEHAGVGQALPAGCCCR